VRTLALTRAVPESIAGCELTHVARTPVDLARARSEHAAYERALVNAGCDVERLPELPAHADSVFVEDCAVVLRELAVIARPGAASRRGEVASVAHALAAQRPLARIESPGTLDGGDVLVLGRALYVGLTRRTNVEGARQLGEHTSAAGYTLETLGVDGALHLKTAVTRAAESVLVVNPRCVDAARFARTGWEIVPVDGREPFAANVLQLPRATLCAAAFPRTNELLRARGVPVLEVEAGELAKAEGGVTCCALLVERA
jgi:dimethylargininase